MGKLKLFLLVRAWVLSNMGNIWIGPWAIFPQYIDHTLCITKYYSVNGQEDAKYFSTVEGVHSFWHHCIMVGVLQYEAELQYQYSFR